MKNNILTIFLNSLGVKCTASYSSKQYNEHPDRNNLFGLSDILDKYGVENTGLRFEDKNDLVKIPPPFLAHIHNGFVLVKDCDENNVHYIWHQTKLVLDIEQFKSIWDGVVLLAKIDEHSIEPNYRQNLRADIVLKVQSGLLLLFMLLSIFVGLTFTEWLDRDRFWSLFAFIFSAVGVVVSVLLVLQQSKLDNGYADRICSAFKKGDCEKVIGAPEAKLFGVFQWSDIGVGYFVGNLILLSFFPHLSQYVLWVNMLTLPFTFWSVWFQKFKAKQWCVLCLTVLLLLWLLFIVSLLLAKITVPTFEFVDMYIVVFAYAFPFLCVSLLMPIVSKAKKYTESQYQINRVKMRDDVFEAIQHKQRKLEVDGVSSVIFGFENAKHTITVITNPHCNPCAKMHHRLEQLLETKDCRISVRYIFSSFSDELDRSGIGLLWICRMLPLAQSKVAYAEWFDGGKDDADIFFRRYNVDFSNPEVVQEYTAHKEWVASNAIAGTPTVLYDGCELADIYTVEDLPYFDDLVVDAN